MTALPRPLSAPLVALLLVNCSPPGPPQEQKEGTITISGVTEDGITDAPLPDVEICVHERDDIPCTKSDLAANFSLINVPQSSEIMLKFFKFGYYEHLAMFTTTTENENFHYGLVSNDGMTLMTGTVGVSIDDNKSQIIFGTNDRKGGERVEGVSVSISPSVEDGHGPFYQTDNGLDGDLTATTAKGIGAFLNLEPGDYELTFTAPGKTCTPHFAWKGSGDGKVKIRLVAGHSTYASAICN
ncbi:MAG: hypothetical protein AB2A00_19635 [Myxococcota bacterium]